MAFIFFNSLQMNILQMEMFWKH